MSQPETLYRLQEVDLNIARTQRRLKQIADILGDDEQIRAAQGQVTAAQDELSPLRSRLRQLEYDIQLNEDKARTTEQQLYSGAIKNTKEMRDMQQEIEALKRWHGELENMLLEAMFATEESEARLSGVQAKLAEVTASKGDEHRQLLEEQARLLQDLETYKARRSQVLTEVLPENLKIYNTMKTKKNLQPIALMTGNTCSICGVAQTVAIEREVRQGVNLVTCSNCERILVSL